jgi:hypothetical protein
MAVDPAGTPSGQPTYIRARAGGEVDGRRVARYLLAGCTGVMAILVIVTAVGAATQNSVQARLQRHGVPVTITVTGCEGVSSGIGQALIYDICRGNFTIGGHQYNEVIGGNRTVHPVGQTLAGVTVPGDPALLSTRTAVAKRFSRWTPFITPIVLAAVTVVLAVLLGLLWRTTRRRRAP